MHVNMYHGIMAFMAPRTSLLLTTSCETRLRQYPPTVSLLIRHLDRKEPRTTVKLGYRASRNSNGENKRWLGCSRNRHRWCRVHLHTFSPPLNPARASREDAHTQNCQMWSSSNRQTCSGDKSNDTLRSTAGAVMSEIEGRGNK